MSHPHDGLNVMMGRPIAFTDQETKSLNLNAARINLLTSSMPHGWRVEVVRHLNAMNRVVHRALERSHAPTSSN